jgi:ketosteroid isomerase-like protein
MAKAAWLLALFAAMSAVASRTPVGARACTGCGAGARAERALHESAAGRSEATASAEIRKLLADQQEAWNRGDQDEFLAGYWQSEATAFAGAQGIVRGWQGLRERYRKGYPDRRAMGTLEFSELEITPLCAEVALALGTWHLEREAGPVGGVFSLVLRRFPEGWRIVADHTSVVPAAAPERKP